MSKDYDVFLFDTDIEQKLIKHFLMGSNSHSFPYAQAVLTPEDFKDSLCSKIFGLQLKLFEEHSDISAPSVMAKAKQEGVELDMNKLSKLVALDYEFIDDPKVLIDYLADLSHRRQVLKAVQSLVIDVNDQGISLETALNDFSNKTRNVTSNDNSIVTIHDTAIDLLNHVQKVANGEDIIGCECGYNYIDRRGGLVLGDLTIVAGETSMGKTAFAMCVALGAAQRGTPIGIISLEMTLQQLTARLVAMGSKVNASDIQFKPLDMHRIQLVLQAAGELCPLPLYFDRSRATRFDKIVKSIRQMVLNQNVKGVVIDYLQLISSVGNKRDRRESIDEIVNSLKALAVELNIFIVLLSQLNRAQSGTDPVPALWRLRDSGAIEQAADNVYFVYRPEFRYPGRVYPDMSDNWSRYETKGTALIINAKSRNGAVGEFIIGFNNETTMFYEKSLYSPATEYDSNLTVEQDAPF